MTNNTGRKEPSLADLEAFEKLLRESLHETPVAAAPAPSLPEPAPRQPDLTHPDLTHPELPHAPLTGADHDAMAELTRLIEQPLDFAAPQRVAQPPAPAPLPVDDLHSHTHIEAPFEREWAGRVDLHAPLEEAVAPALPPAAPAVPQDDPLAAFEEELRRFDATRLDPAPAAPPVAAPELPPEPVPYAPPAYEHYQPPAYQPPAYEAPAPQPVSYAAPEPAPYPYEPAPASPLEAAEMRLAAEAAAASAGGIEAAAPDVRRSRMVFMGLGGLALAGLAVIGGSFMLGGGKKAGGNGEVPVIAARPEPAKEKPANPGGVEIPNQNAQVLAGKDVVKDTGPAKQVVNTLEQPVDLKEITRRESVRIVAPNPFQQAPQTPAANSAQAVTPPPADVEPRRVTSVRVPTGIEGNGASAAAAAAAAAGAAAVANAARPQASPPRGDAQKIIVPSAEELRGDSAKSDARPPKKADPALATPSQKTASASATPKVNAPDKARTGEAKKAEPKKADTKKKDGPMALTGDSAAAPAAPKAAAGSYAVQLASRPTEADAKAAAASLGAKYAGALGRPARVTSGEANGTTVYRVRATGYSQEAATAACNKVKAAGGACFIARQ